MTSHSDHLAHVDNGSWPDLVTLAVGDPQAGWAVIDAARNSRYTGELAFQHDPVISVFFDNGLAYHAVRRGDPSLCDRLIEAGVVDPTQVERGVIRVGSVENLGRLFDRDPSIDRDAVLVVMELATDEVISAIANAPATTFVPTAYRHHVSGVHRWFVGPNAPTQLTPVGEVSQIDASVTSRLPGTHSDRTTLNGFESDDDVEIEWDHPSMFDGERPAESAEPIDDIIVQSIMAEDDAAREAELRAARAAEALAERSADERASRAATERAQRETEDRTVRLGEERITLLATDRAARAAAAGFDPDTADWSQPADASAASNNATAQPLADLDPITTQALITDSSETTSVDADFQITWPDGTEESVHDAPSEPTAVPVGSTDPAPIAAPMFEPIGGLPDESTAHHGLIDDQPVPEDPATLSLSSLPDQVSLDGRPEAVEDAVQRALNAIHSAAPPEPAAAPVLHLVEAPAVVGEQSGSEYSVGVASSQPMTPPPSAEDHASPFAAFAPPTLESSAEAMYARAEEANPTTGEPSVVFVDESDGDRTSALRRLIGSIRRK